jgi:hypothetical protein
MLTLTRAAARLGLARASAAAVSANNAAAPQSLTTVAGGDGNAGAKSGGGMGFRDQEEWLSRGAAAGERAERLAGDEPPEFGLHRAGLGFDLSGLADAIRSSWGGRAGEAAAAVASMVHNPSAARRVPFSQPQKKEKAPPAKEEAEAGDALELPLRWRRMTPDAAADEWWELPSKK